MFYFVVLKQKNTFKKKTFVLKQAHISSRNTYQLKLIGSSLRAFQYAPHDHRTWPVSPAKGGSKTQNGRFLSKIALCLKKVCYKASSCPTCVTLHNLRKCCTAIGALLVQKCTRTDPEQFRTKTWTDSMSVFFL